MNERWSELLGNALYFYDIQRAGTLPDGFRVSWRNNSVPNDGSDVGLDLSGGFFDAGNYIKVSRRRRPLGGMSTTPTKLHGFRPPFPFAGSSRNYRGVL